MTTQSFGRDVSTHELALQEIQRLSKINEELVDSHNSLLIYGARTDDKLRAIAARNLELEDSLAKCYQALDEGREFQGEILEVLAGAREALGLSR